MKPEETLCARDKRDRGTQEIKQDVYEDILFLDRPHSTGHPPMPRADRAVQFAPFAALTGFESMIEEQSFRSAQANAESVKQRTQHKFEQKTTSE